jgi:hypothetical protein
MKIYATSNPQDLHAYLGKDVWIHVSLPDGLSYIKILDISDTNGTVVFREVYDEYIDGESSIDPDDPKLWLYGESPIYKRVEYIDQIFPIVPISILTTSDLYEILLTHIEEEFEE